MLAADVKTSGFGFAHTDWEMPPNARDGKYKIGVQGIEDDVAVLAGTRNLISARANRFDLRRGRRSQPAPLRKTSLWTAALSPIFGWKRI
jgi:hypothetical protein